MSFLNPSSRQVLSSAYVLALPKQKKESSPTHHPKNQKNLDIHCFILYYFVRFYGLIKYKREKG